MVEEVLVKTPLLRCLLDSEEIQLFPTLSSLESSIEAIDILNGEYRAFDASGQLLDLTVDRYGAPRAIPSGRVDDGELRDYILKHYSSSASVVSSTNLDQAVDALKTIYRYSESESF